MGRVKRLVPAKLPAKLTRIRKSLNLSQGGMVKKLGLDCDRSMVSGWERGVKDPPLPVLLVYANLANVYIDDLADDKVELPDELPAKKRH